MWIKGSYKKMWEVKKIQVESSAINCKERAKEANSQWKCAFRCVHVQCTVYGKRLLFCWCLIKSKRNTEKCNHHYECVCMGECAMCICTTIADVNEKRNITTCKKFYCLQHSFHFPSTLWMAYRMEAASDVRRMCRCVWGTLRFVFMSKAHFLWLHFFIVRIFTISFVSAMWRLENAQSHKHKSKHTHIHTHVIYLRSPDEMARDKDPLFFYVGWQRWRICCLAEKTFASIHIHCMEYFISIRTKIRQNRMRNRRINKYWGCEHDVAKYKTRVYEEKN